MMDDLFNYINVWHGTTKVSIAQHWDSPSDRLNGTAAMQEVGIIPDDGDWGSMHIEKYSASLDHLIDVLSRTRDEIDKTCNKSSGEGNDGATQTATGSAT
tara:strand:- start:633 stop:932 length:300 start_codon:yes stop_codon:yes gene_type:complete